MEKIKRVFKRLDLNVNEDIIGVIVSYCVSNGRIYHILAEQLKQISLLVRYENMEERVTDNGSTDVAGMFDEIQKNELFIKFKQEYHKDDIADFDRLLQLELQEESKMQLEEIRNEKSLEIVVENFLAKLLDKIPDEEKMKEMLKQFEGLDKSKISNVMKIVEKIR